MEIKKDATAIHGTISEFIIVNYLFGDKARLPKDGESLIELGIIDSTGILELIEFIEKTFGIQVKESETVPENLGSIANLTRYVSSKKA
jgi:acyl carrier protein